MRIERDIDRTVSFRSSQGTVVRGTLSKLSRRNIVFEIYNPFSPRPDERGAERSQGSARQKRRLSGRCGRNRRRDHKHSGGRLRDAGQQVVGARRHHFRVRRLRSEVARFVDEWERVNKLDPNYQLKVADLRSFLSDLSFWLDQVDLAAEDEHGAPVMALDAEKFEELKAPVMPRLTRLFMELEEACRQLEVDEVENHKLLAQRDLLPLMMASPFFNRVYSKPLGYAGDYEMVNMMFRKERGGKTTYAQVVNDWLLNGGPPQAHRNRIYLLEKMLTKAAEDATFSNKNLRVLNVGCGPVQELQLFIAKNKSAHRFSFDLLDFNAETLGYAKQQIESITADRAEAPKVTYILKTVQELLRQAIEMPANFQSYDIIYCAGLFDYLSDRVCAKLTRLFYQWCEPGGRVIVTNVHSSNPVKGLMEHVMEWHLVMRDELDMVRLVPDLEPLKVYTDDTGINVFLEIEKPIT